MLGLNCVIVGVGLPSISVSLVKIFTVPLAPSSVKAKATVSSLATGASFTGHCNCRCLINF
jgi:hypothetical protein